MTKAAHEKELRRLRYLKNKDKHRERHKAWYAKQDKEALAIKRRANPTPSRYFKFYLRNAQRRSISFELSLEQFQTFWQQPCSYCGAEIQTIGLDRVDNSFGYCLANVVTCCRICNFMKRDLSKSEFIEQCRKIYVRSNTDTSA